VKDIEDTKPQNTRHDGTTITVEELPLSNSRRIRHRGTTLTPDFEDQLL
jgi:hypothetical protein